MQWIACLEGDKEALDTLKDIFNSTTLEVVETEGSYELKSAYFNVIQKPELVWWRAGQIIKTVLRSGILDSIPHEDLTITQIVKIKTKNEREVYSDPPRALTPKKITEKIAEEIKEIQPSGTQRERPQALAFTAVEPVRVGLREESISQALIQLGQNPYSWLNLTSAFENIIDETEGISNFIKRFDVNAKTLERFRWTAKWVEAIGGNKQNAKGEVKRPFAPMSVIEAKSFISDVITKFIRSKLQ